MDKCSVKEIVNYSPFSSRRPSAPVYEVRVACLDEILLRRPPGIGHTPDLFPLPQLALQSVQNNDRTVVTDCVRFCVYVFTYNRTISPCYLNSYMLLALVTPKGESMILVTGKCVCVCVYLLNCT